MALPGGSFSVCRRPHQDPPASLPASSRTYAARWHSAYALDMPVPRPSVPRGSRLGAMPGPTRSVPAPPREPEDVDDPRRPRHRVDHSLSRRRALSSLVLTATGASDALDPHPDLIRAARHHGEASGQKCPWCKSSALVFLRYVFSDELGPFSGRIKTPAELSQMAVEFGFLDVYLVEVCTDCRWNHLRENYVLGDGQPRRPLRRPADLLD